jgi:hypothetical protein
MELGVQIAQYAAFTYGLIHLVASSAKYLVLTSQDVQEELSWLRKHYAAYGLDLLLLRIGVLAVAFGIAVRYADLKVLWGIMLIVYLIGFIGSSWLAAKRLPKELPDVSREQAGRRLKSRWWNLASQLLLMGLWLYSWRHLYL